MDEVLALLFGMGCLAQGYPGDIGVSISAKFLDTILQLVQSGEVSRRMILTSTKEEKLDELQLSNFFGEQLQLSSKAYSEVTQKVKLGQTC